MATRQSTTPPRRRRKNDGRPKKAARHGGRSGKRGGGAPQGAHWLYGAHAVLAALANDARVVHRFLLTQRSRKAYEDDIASALATAESGASAPSSRPAPEVTDGTEMDRILGDHTVHQGIAILVDALVAPSLDEFIGALPPENSRVVVLDQATDPRNVGAIMRSAAAFNAQAMIMQDRHAPPLEGALAKAASGAVERLPVIHVTNLARAIWSLKDAEFWCVGLASDAAVPLHDIEPAQRTALILGAEGKGLRRLTLQTCDQLARIDIAETAGSLNLSNAAAIALYAMTPRA